MNPLHEMQRDKCPSAVPACAEPENDMPLTMPAPPEQAKRDIADAGVEGEPADARAGPGMLRLELLALGLVFAIASALVGVFDSWPVGIVMWVWLALALMVNPVAGAALLRIKERGQAARAERVRIAEHRQGT